MLGMANVCTDLDLACSAANALVDALAAHDSHQRTETHDSRLGDGDHLSSLLWSVDKDVYRCITGNRNYPVAGCVTDFTTSMREAPRGRWCVHAGLR
ncbi:MAG: hypothetical protein ACI835_004906 [Planctomycetota bacterium]|jgi:hypothetical protein